MARLFEGKVALVTGGAAGIGRAAALAFAREGARVVVADMDIVGGEETIQQISDAGGTALFQRADVARADEVSMLVEATIAAYGRLDCALNNAGINEESGPLTECSEALWDRILGVNLKGIWLCMKYEILQMLRQGGGAIVNTSSILGLSGGRGVAAYVASKHGVLGLTRAAAREFGAAGIRVNAVCPGTIVTPMYHRRVPDDPETTARMVADIPVGRLGTPEDVAEAVLWLCSPGAAFVHGHALLADGGELA